MMRAAMAIAVGGSAMQLSGCDPNVRTTLIDGLQATTTSLSTSLITAFFLSIANDAAASDGFTTG
jgi:hypothetical protein